MKGVRGVPGKLLPPIEEGVLGMDPERLRGGLKSDMGVGGAEPFGELAPPPPGERAAGLLLPLWGEPFPTSPTAPLMALDPCTGEGAAAGVPGAGEPAAALLSAEVDRAGDGGGCAGSSVLRPAVTAAAEVESPAVPPSGGGEGGLDDMGLDSCHCSGSPCAS